MSKEKSLTAENIAKARAGVERKKARQRSAKQLSVPVERQEPIVTAVLVLTEEGKKHKQAAYSILENKELQTVARRFVYHDARQQAVMKGEFYLNDIPLSVSLHLQQALKPYWSRYKEPTC